MTRVRVSFRAFLVTLAVGLYAAGQLGWVIEYFTEVPVDLPKTESGETLIVVPQNGNFRPTGGGSMCPGVPDFEEEKPKAKRKRSKR